ncbi:MAG: energy-coupling factor transporter ATPase [Clostridia bacterium]|nr:energy-coupling factor transporter ATPase [Clostridia bacterium]
MEDLIIFDNVTYRYDSDGAALKPAVSNLSLKIKKGEFVAVLGHNGSGKSTLAKLCNAILIPESGRVTVDGTDTADEEKIYDIRRKVGMVFQNPDNQIVATVVEDDVAFGPENLGVEPTEIRRRVDEALKSVGMYEYRLHEPHRLSGGQKQRVAIAGILAMQTDCIVLDEPTAMLDPKGRKEVMQAVKKLNRELSKTVVFITHFMDEAVQADRVIVMNKAEKIMDGTAKEVFSHPERLKALGLDVPAAAGLSHELKKRGIDMPDGILDNESFIEAFERINFEGNNT